MNLTFDISSASNYTSNSQKARILSETWLGQNMYCPRCGEVSIHHFENNRPVADFFCPNCKNQYELKSKCGALGRKISDGAYDTMIARIVGNDNPDFFVMRYSMEDFCVKDLLFVPKHFFVPEIIEKRKPLASTARRAGWIGCNIIIDKIPDQGKIAIVSNGKVIKKDVVIDKVNASNQLIVKDINSRGWLLDILSCVNKIPSQEFTLAEMYAFEEILCEKHPDNHNIKPKIRQQLQLLRDRGVIAFLGAGQYQKVY